MCAKYHGDLCKIECARLRTKISVQILDPKAAAAASNQSKNIGPIFMWDLINQSYDGEILYRDSSGSNLGHRDLLSRSPTSKVTSAGISF